MTGPDNGTIQPDIHDPFNPTVIKNPPEEVVSSSSASVEFFSNANNLHLVEGSLWFLWIILVVILFVLFKRIFMCVRKTHSRDAADLVDVNEMETFSGTAGDNANVAFSGRDTQHHLPRKKTSFFSRPFDGLKKSHHQGDLRLLMHNLMVLFGFMMLYFLVCYILTIVSIVTFIKCTEDAEVFGRGIKCPNSTKPPSSQSQTTISHSMRNPQVSNSTFANSTVRPVETMNVTLHLNRDFCDYSLPLEHKEFYLKTSLGDTIHVWWIPRTVNRSTPFTAVLHHGAISLMTQYGPAYQKLTSMGVSVAAYDYPFYGRSTGLPSESALYAAGEAVLEFAAIHGGVASLSDVINIGNSLGGPITIEMAARHNSKAIILISAMDNSFKVVNHFLKLTGWVVNLFIKYYYDGFTKISTFKGCLFHYIALQDSVIPPDRGREMWLQATQKNPNCSVLVENPYCGHTCENYLFEEFVDTLKSFLNNVEVWG